MTTDELKKIHARLPNVSLKELRSILIQLVSKQATFLTAGDIISLIRYVLSKMPVNYQDKTIELLLREGKKIAAIRLYRERTGLGLIDAKHFVEEIQDKIENEKNVSLSSKKKMRLRHRPAPKSKKRK
jgi:ribosomal protein L7/L12